MSEHTNRLTPAEHERLSLLIEECAEVIQAGTKILRHGYESYNPFDNSIDNRHDLEKEIGHVMLAYEFMMNQGDVNPHRVQVCQKDKRLDIAKWLHHQPEELFKS